MTTPLADATKMLFEATKAMIPVVTGFLVFFAGTLPKLWKPTRPLLLSERRALLATIVLGVSSLVTWAWVIPCCILSTEGGSLFWFHFSPLCWFQFGQIFARIAHLLFLFSVCCALSLYYHNFVKGYAKPSDAA